MNRTKTFKNAFSALCAMISLLFAGVAMSGAANATTFVRSVTLEELTAVSQSGAFDFGAEFTSIESVNITVDPCFSLSLSCIDGFGVAEMLDLGFGNQTFTLFRGFAGEGEAFSGPIELSTDNLADLMDGFIAFTASVSFPDLFDIVAPRVSSLALILTVEGETLETISGLVDGAVAETPLPAGAPLLLTGLAGVAFMRRRRHADAKRRRIGARASQR